MPIDPDSIRQGTIFWAHFTLRPINGTSTIEETVLEQMLPTGWEIENTRLSGESMPAWSSKWTLGRLKYTDIRDDRIRWFFDLPSYGELDFLVKLNAVSSGRFTLPPSVSQAMYDKTLRSVIPGRLVTVGRARGN